MVEQEFGVAVVGNGVGDADKEDWFQTAFGGEHFEHGTARAAANGVFFGADEVVVAVGQLQNEVFLF